MIYIAERHVEDYLHVLANVNTIRIFKKAFPGENIQFISARAHNLKVQGYLKDTPQLEFIAFSNRKPAKNITARALSLMKRAIDDVFFFRRLLRNATIGDLIIVSHIYPHSLIFFNILKRFYPAHIVLVLLHGEVEYTLFAHGIAQKLIGATYKLSFWLRPQNLNYIFLTKAAEKIIKGKGLNAGTNPIFIELPTIVAAPLLPEKDIHFEYPVNIGHIGSAGKRKNVDQLYVLADKINDLIIEKNVQLSAIGVLEASIKPYLSPLVINFVNDRINEPIDRATFDQEISRLHYAVFFYGLDDFLLRSSAAFFDAVLYEKPIIALKSRFFIALFETYGEMGYLAKDLTEMQTIIHQIVIKPNEAAVKQSLFKNNIKAYKATLSIDNIADDLKKQVSNLLPEAMMQT